MAPRSLLIFGHLQHSARAHLKPLLVDIDPSNSHSFLHMLVGAVFGSHLAVVEVLTRPLQSSLHVICAEARYKTFAHSAPASFFTRVVYSFSTDMKFLPVSSLNFSAKPSQVTYPPVLSAGHARVLMLLIGLLMAAMNRKSSLTPVGELRNFAVVEP